MKRAYNMKSRNGNPVTNQIIIEEYLGNNSDGYYTELIFQSYGVTIAILTKNEDRNYNGSVTNDYLTLDKDNWDYSRTTLRYLNKFINENTEFNTNTAKIRKLIKNDIIELSDLN
tara:strand:+ start:253 stop:597 length:345 start_codon:yes stop_codon:yes gene_type:complete